MRAFPWTYQTFVGREIVNADGFVEMVNMVGVVVSAVVASGLIQHGFFFVAITSMYYFLYVVGGTFYSFQWDILLLETGFLTALCFAPWQSLRINQTDQRLVGAWPIRFLLFKLMFMSGVVKIQADCPTWNNLTALEYHFATQCLPGPLAWHAHQLPPMLLRLGVAATFVIEIPASFMLVFPTVRVRQVGAWLQVLLQLMIMLTGNYNFFNLLTVVLCVPCFICDTKSTNTTMNPLQPILNALQYVASVAYLAWSSSEMFEVYNVQDSIHNKSIRTGIKLAMTKYDCNRLIERVVPIVVSATLLFTVLSGLRSIATAPRRGLSSIVNCVVCFIFISTTALPLFDLTPNMHQQSMLQSTLRSIRGAPFVISNGYGLFRRMTGVGRYLKDTTNDTGWAGLPPSIVARPEITIEAVIKDAHSISSLDTTNEVWQELTFRWKPGDVSKRPLQVAPHQPRFDWLMWFAALGTYRQNPWLLAFVDKLLKGCPSVIDLLKEPDLSSGVKKITRVRASLYEYDFTRLNTDWARRIPGVHVLENNENQWRVLLFRYPKQVWMRKLSKQYLPTIDQGSASLQQFLYQSEYGVSDCKSMRQQYFGVDRAVLIAMAVWLVCSVVKHFTEKKHEKDASDDKLKVE